MWSWPSSPPLSNHAHLFFLHILHITKLTVNTTTIHRRHLPSSSSFSIFLVVFFMANHAFFRSSLVCLALVVVVVGICTQSLRKMMVTYLVGVVGIAGVLLPDWAYFDRDFSRWGTPVSVEERAAANATAEKPGLARIKRYPMRLAAYTTIYGLTLYKWWEFVSS